MTSPRGRRYSIGKVGSEAAFLVLCMATKDMDDDIRQIMAEIKAMNQAKQKMRDSINELDNAIAGEIGNRVRARRDKEIVIADGIC